MSRSALGLAIALLLSPIDMSWANAVAAARPFSLAASALEPPRPAGRLQAAAVIGSLSATSSSPELPRASMETSLPVLRGRVIWVPAEEGGWEAVMNTALRAVGIPAGALQSTLNAARPGDIVELSAGITYEGNVILPEKPGEEWITIRSSAYSQLPSPGARVSPADAHLMAKIASPNWVPAIRTARGAHHYRFIGIEVTTANPVNHQLIRLEFPGQSSLEDMPTDIVFDRCYIHGSPMGNIRRGIALNGARLAVIDSYLSDFHEEGRDSEAIIGWNGPGPFVIEGNYLEAAGVNVMFGGADPTIPNLVPADITIRRNLFSKPLAWKIGDPAYMRTAWSVKTLFELKNARRVLLEGNVLEHNWVQADQQGFAIVLTPRNQKGTAPWSVVEDVTIRNNIVRHSTAGVTVLGWDNNQPSGQTKRVLIQNNLFTDIGGAAWAGGDRTGRLFQLVDGTADVVIDHNTAFQAELPLFVTRIVSGREVHTGFVFTNNILLNNGGVSGDFTYGDPLHTLQRYLPDAVFARNVLIGGQAPRYPPDNFFPPTLSRVGFIDLSKGDFRLADTSQYHRAGTDGRDIGADPGTFVARTRARWRTAIRALQTR